MLQFMLSITRAVLARRAWLTWARRAPRALRSVVLLGLLTPHAALADEPTVGGVPARSATDPSAGVTLNVTGFSDANAAQIRARAPMLSTNLAFLGSTVLVTVEFVPKTGMTLITVDESAGAELSGLGLRPYVMGLRYLDYRRATLAATQVNAWVSQGPVRDAFNVNNGPLVAALGNRAIGVRYKNAQGDTLVVPFAPRTDGAVDFGGLVVVRGASTAVQIPLLSEVGEVPLPVGADGQASPSMALYRFFGVVP